MDEGVPFVALQCKYNYSAHSCDKNYCLNLNRSLPAAMSTSGAARGRSARLARIADFGRNARRGHRVGVSGHDVPKRPTEPAVGRLLRSQRLEKPLGSI